MVNEKQQQFIASEFWNAAWNASVQHVSVYGEGVTEKQRRKFKNEMFNFVYNCLLSSYRKTPSEDKHYENIESLIKHGTLIGAEILKNGAYQYGVAQKLLNLYLKYYWCAEKIAEPPHCPIDGVILKILGLPEIKWTQISQESEYKRVIEEIKMRLTQGEPSISRWELRHYMDANRPIADLPLTSPARPSAKPSARGTPARPD
jgi:hypothetical protein